MPGTFAVSGKIVAVLGESIAPPVLSTVLPYCTVVITGAPELNVNNGRCQSKPPASMMLVVNSKRELGVPPQLVSVLQLV